MQRIKHIGSITLLLLGFLAFGGSVLQLKRHPFQNPSPEIQVALPLFAQVALSIGDRYLAANFASIRALVTSTARMKPEEYRVLAKVQQDASWLNPAHEDNYYIAGAILPWSGELEAAQIILRRASLARPYDYQPAFLYAFNLWHFKGESIAAANWLRMAAEKLPDDDDRLVMLNLAAKWVDKSDDLDTAINVVKALAQQAKRADFRKYLEARVQRLRDLKALRAQAEIFEARYGRPLQNLEELKLNGLIKDLPSDPFGFGFELDAKRQIILKTRP